MVCFLQRSFGSFRSAGCSDEAMNLASPMNDSHKGEE